MADTPTQELPPWYTLITSTAADAAGNPTATLTTLMRLPLTYYGPSIPLGTDTNIWVYGGPTPPSTTDIPPVTPTPPSSTSAAPTPSSTLATSSSALSPTSSTTPSETSSLSVTSSTGSSTLTVPPSTSGSTSPGPTSASGSPTLGRTAIGVIVGSIIAALIILLCCLLALRWRRSRRRHREGHDLLTPVPERHRHSRLYSFTDDSPQHQPVETAGPREPIWTGWSMVHASGESRTVPPVEGGWTLVHDNGSDDRVPGEGSPRGSGEETDPFLRASYSNQMSQHPSARLVTPAPVLATHNSLDSTSTGASGYGTVVEPSQSRFSHLVPAPITQWGNILPPAVLTHMVDEPRRHDDIMEEDEEQSLLEPPRRLDPDRLGTSRITPRPSAQSLMTSRSGHSLPPPTTPASLDETPELMTAQRIRVDEMDRAEAREVPSPTTDSPSLLGRLGWLNRRSRQGTPERQESRPTTPHLGPEVEAGPSSRLLGHLQETRPISGYSGASVGSGSTVFHDAQSRNGTPPPPLPSPPPALTASSRSRWPVSEPMQESTSEAPTIRVVGTSSPSHSQADDMDPFADTSSSTVVQDPLDSPAPTSRFATTSYERDPTFPPSLVVSRSWMSSSGGDSDRTGSPAISMDVYEEAPPPVAERWRFMTGGGGPGRPTQRPVLVHPRDVTRSEAGSLHSTRSRLSPGSPRSVSGSAPTSLFQHTPDSSQGSKSHGRSHGSGHSLIHQTSISSQGRRRRRRPEIGESPLPSPYGRLSLGATGTSAMRFDFGQRDVGPISPDNPFSTYFTVDGSINSAGTNITTEVVDPVTGAAVRMPRMPAYSHDREDRHSFPYSPLGD